MHIAKYVASTIFISVFLYAPTATAQTSTFDCWSDGVHVTAVQDAFPEMSIMDAWVMKGVLDSCPADMTEDGALMQRTCGNLIYMEECHAVPCGSCGCFGRVPLFFGNACVDQIEPALKRALDQYLMLLLSKRLLSKKIKVYLKHLQTKGISKWSKDRLRRKIRTGMSLFIPTEIMIYKTKRIIRQLTALSSKFEQGDDVCLRVDDRITSLTDEIATLEARQQHYFGLANIYATELQ